MLATGLADEIEIELLVERRVHRIRYTDKQEHIAVRCCTHDAFGADIAAGACSVLNDEWLPQSLRQRLTNETRDVVGCLAGGKGDDDAHWARRIALRQRDAWQTRQRGSARSQMQEFAAGNVHDNAPGNASESMQTAERHHVSKSAEGGNDRSLLVTADNPVFSFHGHTGR